MSLRRFVNSARIYWPECPAHRVVAALALGALATGLTTGTSACADPSAVASFDADAPDARIRAVRSAVASQDRSAIPNLISLLASDDPAERLLAIRALEQMTGQTLDYDHAGRVEDRSTSIKRWSEWYAASSATSETGSPKNRLDHVTPTSGT